MAMKEHMSESLEPYEPPDDYEWDYDEAAARHDAPKVLWGRIAILGALVLAAFLIGRTTSGGGIPASDLERAEKQAEDARADVAALQQRVETLEADLAAAQQQQDPPLGTDPAADPNADDEGDAPAADVQTHTVAPGETLTDISEKYYDDTGYADYIADYNGIADPTMISVGMDLEIPPEPEG